MRKLPHPERTIVNIDKLVGYCLNPEHSDGQHKARVFKSALNIGIEDFEFLKTALLNAVHQNVAIPTKRNAYGEKYVIDFEMNHSGQTAMVRSAWIVRDIVKPIINWALSNSLNTYNKHSDWHKLEVYATKMSIYLWASL